MGFPDKKPFFDLKMDNIKELRMEYLEEDFATHKENAPNQSQQTKPYTDAEALKRSPIKMDKPADNIHTEIKLLRKQLADLRIKCP